MFPKEIEIVDGYNALFALARLEKDDSSYRFSIERRYFLEILKRRTRKERIVVFDNPNGSFQLKKMGPLWVLFTGSGQSADDLILEMLMRKTTSKPLRLLVDTHHRKICVITNDRKLRERIKAIRPDVEVKRVESKFFN